MWGHCECKTHPPGECQTHPRPNWAEASRAHWNGVLALVGREGTVLQKPSSEAIEWPGTALGSATLQRKGSVYNEGERLGGVLEEVTGSSGSRGACASERNPAVIAHSALPKGTQLNFSKMQGLRL